MNPVDRFLLTEASLGCLMAVLGQADAAPIVEWLHDAIPADALTGDGYESCPHVTVAYGFDAAVTATDIAAAIAAAPNPMKRVVFTLGNVSRFSTNPAYDVLKVDVHSSDLTDLNGLLSTAFGESLTQNFAYNAHMTLAYVKKGALQDLDGHGKLNGNTYVLDRLVFSLPGSTTKSDVELDPVDPAGDEPAQPVAAAVIESRRGRWPAVF